MQLKKQLPFIVTALSILIAFGFSYYFISQKKAPYPASEFKAIIYKWGIGNNLVNVYNSATKKYQYLNDKDELVTTKVSLRADDMIYLHSTANELGFWKLPTTIGQPQENALHFEITFVYSNKVKQLFLYQNENNDIKQMEQALQIRNLVAETINKAEERYGKN